MKFVTTLFICLLLPAFGFADGMRFQCGNHHPAHIAGSLEEAQRLSLKEKCTDWDVHGVFKNDSYRKHLLEILNGKQDAAHPSD
jgi:hypothetical protein